MEISKAKLVERTEQLEDISKKMANAIENASQQLLSAANHIEYLTRGSRSGETSVYIIFQSAKSLKQASLTLGTLSKAAIEYIAAVQQ
jgi:hypothetical protein